MKTDLLYRELKDLAEKLGIRVLEHNFRTTGIHVKSGPCKVKGKDHFVIDKHLRMNQKTEALGEYLAMYPTDAIYIVPAVREHLDRLRPKHHPPVHFSDGDGVARSADISTNEGGEVDNSGS